MELLDKKDQAIEQVADKEKHIQQLSLLNRENLIQSKKISELDDQVEKYKEMVVQHKEKFIQREKELLSQIASLEKEKIVQTQISTT